MKTKTVLLIDDDNIQHYITKVTLKKVDPNIELISYLDASEAFEFINEISTDQKPDFILLDLDMPNMDGWQFLDVYKNCKNKSDVYIVSSSIDVNDMKKSKDYQEVKQFISKPLNAEKINLILNKPIPIK
jgi:CheY-like chemotaxis protein